jgi:peroxiredoxin/catechol 2,3-dioxygenase-like lactoylglutathione lyase family enzyme
MKAKYVYLFLPLFIGALACAGSGKKKTPAAEAADGRGYIVEVGEMAPDFSLQLTNGETVRLSDLRGKVVMLQFTASWCGVCRKEMPFIERDIWRKYRENPDFYLLGIDRDEPLDKVREFIRQTGITYPVALDPGGDVFARYAERNAGITRNVIINAEGRIAMLTRLYDEEEFAGMCTLIDELLNNKFTFLMEKTFTGIDHPAIAAADVESLSKWYRNTLGYEVFAKTDKPIYILKAADGTLMEIMPKDETARPERTVNTPGWSHLAIRVSDFDVAMKVLSELGVAWEGPEFVAVGGGRIRNFTDPEGNLLQIIQR